MLIRTLSVLESTKLPSANHVGEQMSRQEASE